MTKKGSRIIKKIFFILVTIHIWLIVTTTSFSLSQIICVLPESEEKFDIIQNNFISLKEPQTIAKFDKQGNLMSIHSPNCNKFESSAVWTHKIKISCGSNSGEKISITINMKNLTFHKQTSTSPNKISHFSGICRSY